MSSYGLPGGNRFLHKALSTRSLHLLWVLSRRNGIQMVHPLSYSLRNVSFEHVMQRSCNQLWKSVNISTQLSGGSAFACLDGSMATELVDGPIWSSKGSGHS